MGVWPVRQPAVPPTVKVYLRQCSGASRMVLGRKRELEHFPPTVKPKALGMLENVGREFLLQVQGGRRHRRDWWGRRAKI